MMGLRALGLWLTLALPVAAWADPVVGLYPGNHPFAAVATSDAVRDALEPTAVRLGLIGDFIDIEAPGALDRIRASLDIVWASGAVYLLNLMTTTALQPLAWPASPADWARSNTYYALAATIKAWGEACGACHMILVPYPEHNGGWVPYGHTPADYIEAHGKLRYVLWQTGALRYVKMAWGPSVADLPGMVPYFPGAAWTEYVGCSAYQDLALVRLCVDHLRLIAPGKPILLTQTAACQPDSGAWASALVAYLRRQPDVAGFVWFQYDKECDWQLTPAEWRRAVSPLDPRTKESTR